MMRLRRGTGALVAVAVITLIMFLVIVVVLSLLESDVRERTFFRQSMREEFQSLREELLVYYNASDGYVWVRPIVGSPRVIAYGYVYPNLSVMWRSTNIIVRSPMALASYDPSVYVDFLVRTEESVYHLGYLPGGGNGTGGTSYLIDGVPRVYSIEIGELMGYASVTRCDYAGYATSVGEYLVRLDTGVSFYTVSWSGVVLDYKSFNASVSSTYQDRFVLFGRWLGYEAVRLVNLTVAYNVTGSVSLWGSGRAYLVVLLFPENYIGRPVALILPFKYIYSPSVNIAPDFVVPSDSVVTSLGGFSSGSVSFANVTTVLVDLSNSSFRGGLFVGVLLVGSFSSYTLSFSVQVLGWSLSPWG